MPGPSDTVQFDGTGSGGKIFDSVDIVGATTQVASLIIKSTYTGKLTLNQDLTVGGQDVNAQGQTADTAEIDGGTITGIGNIYVSDNVGVGPPAYLATLLWTGGTLNLAAGSYVQLGSSGSGTITGAADKTLDTCNFHNYSPNLTWDGAGNIVLKNAASFYAADGSASVFALQPQARVTAQIRGSVNENFRVDHETMNVNTGGGSLEVKARFDNWATVNARDGQTSLHAVQNSGTMTVFNGATLNLGVGTSPVRLDSTAQGATGSTITGTGITNFWFGSNIAVYGTANVGGTVDDQSSTIDGPGTLQINGYYTLERAAMQNTLGGAGAIQVGSATNATAQLMLSNALVPATAYTLGRPIINYGTIVWQAPVDITVTNGGSIDNKAGAIFDIQVDQTMAKGAGAGGFTNAGTLRKSIGRGTATIQIIVTNNGTVRNESGTLSIMPWLLQAVAGSFLIVDSGTTLNLGGGFEQDAGTVTTTYGTVNITGNYLLTAGTATFATSTMSVSGLFDQTGGTATFSNLTLTAGGVHIESGGMLYGRGAWITGDVVNDGTIDLIVGSSVPSFTITGNYTQTGTLVANLAGTTTGGGLAVSGTAYLGGLLKVQLLGSYVPYPGSTFRIVSFGTLGSPFGALSLPSIPYGHWIPEYTSNPNTFTLLVSFS
jgi:hypothetical protein